MLQQGAAVVPAAEIRRRARSQVQGEGIPLSRAQSARDPPGGGGRPGSSGRCPEPQVLLTREVCLEGQHAVGLRALDPTWLQYVVRGAREENGICIMDNSISATAVIGGVIPG